jgi:hypothetical protein
MDGIDWIEVAQDKDRPGGGVLVNEVMKRGVHEMQGIY